MPRSTLDTTMSPSVASSPAADSITNKLRDLVTNATWLPSLTIADWLAPASAATNGSPGWVASRLTKISDWSIVL